MSQSSEFDPARLVLSPPSCPECGTVMWLEQIEAVEPGQDKRIFDCPRCEHRHTEVVKYR